MTSLEDLHDKVHRRRNPLTGEWVLVSPHRAGRPWQGQVEPAPTAQPPSYDPLCYLCPGNTRANGAVNPSYASTFVFDNDFPALLPDQPPIATGHGLLTAIGETGRCRVICYSPHHHLSLGQMTPAQIRQVIDTWAAQYSTLGAMPDINAVTIFENRGAIMGASNPHPHGQIWANQSVPDELLRETEGQSDYLSQRGSCLLCDYSALEAHGERWVCGNELFMAVVPFWAVWPFEILVLPRRHVATLEMLDSASRDAFAELLRELTARYDNLFKVPFPYTMGLHQRPTQEGDYPEWHMHAHFYPPLLRSATVRKFMVGYEMLAGAQRDITPEAAAVSLRQAAPIRSR